MVSPEMVTLRLVPALPSSTEITRVGEYENSEDGFRLLVSTDQIAIGEPIITTQLPRAIDGLLVSVANDS